MDNLGSLLLSGILVISLFVPSLAQTQTCRNHTFSGNRNYMACSDLPRLSSYLYWNYHPSNMTVDISFRKTGTTTNRWIAWALNPSGGEMSGSQALVAFRHSNGSTIAYTTPILNTSPSMLPGRLSFDVPNITAESSDRDMIIFATLRLDNSLISTNQVWQEGPLDNNVPAAHLMGTENRNSVSRVDFQRGTVTSSGSVTTSTDRKRNIHGVLNAVSWGILMPTGVIIARYLRVFKSAGAAWFYLHVACQSSAYAVGVAGWATGIKLGSDSPGITHNTHRRIGIILFCLGTLQVFALLLRPKPDHKYRLYWNMYHHGIGYAIIALSIFNIFEGFSVLGREDDWKKAYTIVIICLGAIALILEAFTWIIVLRRKKTESSEKHINGVNGHSSRAQQTV